MAGLQMQSDKIARLLTCCFPASISLRRTCDSYVGLARWFSTPARIHFSLFIEAIMVGFSFITGFAFNDVAAAVAVERELLTKGVTRSSAAALSATRAKTRPAARVCRKRTPHRLSRHRGPTEWEKPQKPDSINNNPRG